MTALFNGVTLRNREDSPSNFSFFLVLRKKPLVATNRKANMILQLKVSQGKGWDEMDYKEALKQGIDTPDSIQNMAFQF